VFIGALCFAGGLLLATAIVPDRQDTTRTTVQATPGAGDDGGQTGELSASSTTIPGQASPGVAPPGSSSPNSPIGTPGGGGPARGVTADKIRIGVAYNVTPAALTFSPKFNSGDGAAQFNAMLARWRSSGELPVNGRDVEFVYRPLDISSPEQQRSACVSLVKDEQVFAVISTQLSQSFNDCVTQEFKTPLVTVELESAGAGVKSGPYLFSLTPTIDEAYAGLVAWAKSTGKLDGHKIGLYTSADQQFAEARDILKSKLSAAGASIAVDVTAPAGGSGLASSTDATAVQQFRSNNVDIAFVLTNRSGFTQQASAQGYKPQYLEADPFAATNDLQSSLSGPASYDGAQARTSYRYGEGAAEMPLQAATKTCYDNYNAFAKKNVQREGTTGTASAEQAQVLYTCDLANVVLAGLKAAGRDLNATAYIAGLESIRALPMANLADVSFGPSDHNGANLARTLVWMKSCTCWKASGSFEPLPR
jgi:hypothetical protein